MQMHTNMGPQSVQQPIYSDNQHGISPDKNHAQILQQQNMYQSSSGGNQSQNSSANQNVQFNQIRLQSEVLELIQTLSLDLDQLSPVEVRQHLRQLVTAEQDARVRRETYLNELMQQRAVEIETRFKEQIDQLKVQFEQETVQFEKTLKDRAQGIIKGIQINQLDRLINIVGRIRQIHNLHGGNNSSQGPSAPVEQQSCKQTQVDLQSLIQHVDSLMAQLSGDDAKSFAMLDQFNLGSQEGNQMATPFNHNLRDQVLAMQQKSSNGVVANKARHNQAVVAAHPIGLQTVPAGVRFGTATSYGGVTSGDGLPISTSNILSPNTTPSQEFPQPAEATLSNPQIQNMQRSNTTGNQFKKVGANGRPRFVYDLPQDFPFNEACIEKSFSNDLANSAFKSGSHPNGSHSQNTTSNHDVNPEDVLRTFTNSLHSGGTLGAIHSSLTYYKEALASKEFSNNNMSPSNAYHNFMWKKNLVGEIQKLAKEISRIPTEEAKILADLSKSHLSQDGSKAHGFVSGQQIGMPVKGNQWPSQPPPGMTTAEAISKGLGFIGNNESSILMDLNRASIVAAQKEAEDLKQKAKRIVDDSATRLEPVVKSFTDAPLNQQMMKSQIPQGSNPNYQQQHFIQYQQQPSGSIQDSQGTLPEQRHNSSSQNMQMMYEQQRANNDSMLRDSCVMYEDIPAKQNNNNNSQIEQTQESLQQQSPQQVHPHLNYHASNERSQLSESEEGIVDETHEQFQTNHNPSHQPRGGVLAQAVQSKIASSHRRHGSVVVGEHTIQNRIETGPPQGQMAQKQRDTRGREINVYAERRSIQHGRDELSPKQLRNESLSVQRSSIAAKRKVKQMGFFSNDAAATFTDMELDQIENAQNFQQTTSFAPQNKTPWWLEDAHEISQNQVLFQQTAGPNMHARNVIANKLKSSRRRGTQSVRSHHPSFTQQNVNNGQTSAISGHEQVIARFGDQNLENNALDNKGRAVRGTDQTSGNLYDELSRVAEYQSSRSVLDGASSKARNQHNNLNRTMQVKKQKNQIHSTTGRQKETPQSGPTYNREVISKSVLTNGDRASPSISASGATNGSRIAKMKIKNNQIKLVNNTSMANKRNSIQMPGQLVNATGQQSKSVSREGRLKVKLVHKNNTNNTSVTPGIDQDQMNGQNNGEGMINSGNQSPSMSRNDRRLVMATGPSKSSQGNNNFNTEDLDHQRQRNFSPQNQNSQNWNNLQGGSNQTSAYANKIPFKSSNKDSATKREEASSASGHRIRNNFFTENAGDQQQQQQLQEQSMDSSHKRQMNNISQLSAPIGSSNNQQQPLKIRRNRKQAKRATSPTNDDSNDQEQPDNVNEQEEAEEQFNEIARNLRDTSQHQSNNIFIRKGSSNIGGAYESGNSNQAQTALLYGAGSVQQSREETGKQRQPFVRTYKTQKSRQAEDLDRPFGTERVAFHKSALMSNNQGYQKNNMTQEEAEQQMQKNYKRPKGSVNNQNNAVTLRVQSNSQPPFAGQISDQTHMNLDEPQIIPPPTEQFMIDETAEDQNSTPGQLSGGGSIQVNAKRPVVKMTAINFIASDNQSHEQQKHSAQVSNFASQPNSSTNGSAQGQFSFHHPQQPTQSKFPSHAKKPSLAAQVEASPYMTQHKVAQNPTQAAANKRIIHLKRPSTNFQMGATNQPNLVGKNAFAQRAASRVEQSDRQSELAFQNNSNNGATSGGSVMSAIQRPTAQIRISKKTGLSHKINNMV